MPFARLNCSNHLRQKNATQVSVFRLLVQHTFQGFQITHGKHCQLISVMPVGGVSYKVIDKNIMELTATYDDERADHRVVYQARNR